MAVLVCKKNFNKIFVMVPLFLLFCGTVPVFSQVPRLGQQTLLQLALNQLPAVPIPQIGNLKFEFGGEAWMAKLNGQNISAGTITLHNTNEGNILVLKQTHIYAVITWVPTPGADINLEYKRGPPVSLKLLSSSELEERLASIEGAGSLMTPPAGQASINETQAGGIQTDNNTSAVTPSEPSPVNIAAIGLTAPVTGRSQASAINENAQYGGTVIWSPASGTFNPLTVYTATITLTAKSGYTLQGIPANFFTVAGATSVRNNANSGVITAVFPRTAEPSVNIAAIQGVTVPSPVDIPVTAITETAQYRGTVTWSPAVLDTFKPETEYTAIITLTAKTGFSLQGVPTDFFTVEGAVSVRNNADSGVVTAVFPKIMTINIAAIKGVTAPVTGKVPVTAISETEQYNGTIIWSPEVSEVFEPETEYIATITLTAKPGYTFVGVDDNFFNVARAASANNANSGVVTAVFPPTKEKMSIFPEDGKLWLLGGSIGTSFAAPQFTVTLHGTLAPFNGSLMDTSFSFDNTFLDLGMDFGFGINRPDIEYFSLYPFVNYALFTPFPRRSNEKRNGWYAGAGLGVMLANYIFDAAGPIWDATVAVNFVAGVIIFDMIDVSYSIRTNFRSADTKLSIGYVYRFK